jgi:uncharacterized protein (TIGR03437 family)
MLNRPFPVLAMAVMAVSAASGQKTTNFTYSITITDETVTTTHHAEGSGVGSLGALGLVHIHVELAQGLAPNVSPPSPLEDFKGTISFVFNRLDSFDVAVTIPNGNGNPPPINGTITGGKGAYQGATGSVTFTVTGFAATQPRTGAFFGGYQLAATGSVTVAGKTTNLALSAGQVISPGSRDDFLDTNIAAFTISPLGSGTVTLAGSGGDNNTRNSALSTFKFNDTDSIIGFLTFIGENPPPDVPGVIVGGTGAYAGATGSFTIANIAEAPDGKSFTLTGSGAITTGATGLPVITEVTTAFGKAEIVPNSWTVIKGTNLVPANTPSTGVIWSSAPEFASGKMPTNLQGMSVTVNGVPAYVYFYCSAATDKDCATDQINILTPLDSIGDTVPASIVVTNGSVSSAAFIVNEISFAEPSFLLFSTKGHVVAVHLDGSLLGPTSLYPGLSTPAKAGETVLVFGIGFGTPKGGATQGSATQAGAVQAGVQCSIGNKVVQGVPANIISPGLAQFNLTIPAGTPSGDNLIFCAVGPFPAGGNGHTPSGNLITVQ